MKLEDAIKQKSFSREFEKMMVNIIYTNSWFSLQMKQTLEPYGISMQQYNLLRILKGQYPKPASVRLLIDRMLDKMSNASRLVDKLKKKELVERKECPTDRRKVEVLITEEGIKLLEVLNQKVKLLEKDMFLNISEEEAKIFNVILDKLRS